MLINLWVKDKSNGYITKSAQMFTIALSSLTDSLAITICRTVAEHLTNMNG